MKIKHREKANGINVLGLKFDRVGSAVDLKIYYNSKIF